MTPDKKNKVLMDMNTEDFNVMRSMLSEIEMKIMQVDPIKQKQFYLPLQQIILEAWSDACNPDDSFLFPKPLNDESD
jgi:hypothetical protein